jgi:hypothetical protein
MLKGALKPEHRAAGLWLSPALADERIVNLIYKGSVKASFEADRVTVADIRTEADKVLWEIKRN